MLRSSLKSLGGDTEALISQAGLEGGAVYALSRWLREAADAALPGGFRWREGSFTVAGVLRRWREHGPCRHVLRVDVQHLFVYFNRLLQAFL